MARAGRWVVEDARVSETAGAPRLLCIPHAGGSPSFFRSWRAALAPEIAVRPVLLPGRESRMEEKPYRDIASLIGPLCAGLEPYLDQPYALFGHSMGAVIAYEVARRFSGGPMRPPVCLLVSGHRTPGLEATRKQLFGLPDDEFVTEVGRLNGIPPEVLAEPELMRLLLPTMKADFELVDTYQPLPGGILQCPVVAYVGTNDPEVATSQILGWRDLTSGEFAIRVFSGDHFYLKDGRPDVLAAVREDMSPARAGALSQQ